MRTSRVQCACNLTPRVHDPFVVSTQVVMDGTLVANKLPTAMQREKHETAVDETAVEREKAKNAKKKQRRAKQTSQHHIARRRNVR